MWSFKTVFFVVGDDQDDKELDRAVAIASELGAHLSVLVVGIAPPPPASPYGVVSNDIWASDIRDGQAAVEARTRALEEKLAGTDISSIVEGHYVDRGTVATLAARFARYSDLTLATPAVPGYETLQSAVVDGALFDSGRPVLLVPTGAVSFPKVSRVMIAWDASVEASKAVRDAIGIMQSAQTVDAVLIDPVPSFDGHGQEPGADLATYLGRHGIETTIHRVPKEGKETGELLQRTARDLNADLIVMGGFGHSRLRQRIFGGTTTTMLKAPLVPVLMAH